MNTYTIGGLIFFTVVIALWQSLNFGSWYWDSTMKRVNRQYFPDELKQQHRLSLLCGVLWWLALYANWQATLAVTAVMTIVNLAVVYLSKHRFERRWAEIQRRA